MAGDRTPLKMTPQELETVAKAMDLLAHHYREAAKKVESLNPDGIKVRAVKLFSKTKKGLISCAGAIQEAILAFQVESPIWDRMENVDDAKTQGKATAQDLTAEENLAAEKKSGKKTGRKKRG